MLRSTFSYQHLELSLDTLLDTAKYGRSALLCCVRALAMHLIQRFWIENEALPDPASGSAFNEAPLFPTQRSPHKNISYQQQSKAFNEIFAMLGLAFNASTHCGRIGGSRQLDEGGCDAQVSTWLNQHVCQSSVLSLQSWKAAHMQLLWSFLSIQ